MLLGCLVHIDSDVLLPVLARRATVLSLIAEAEAASLVRWAVSCCLGCRYILIVWRLSTTATRPPRLPAMIALSGVVACTHISETASFITSATSTCLVRMIAA
jgi:hypothetical protein